MPAADKELVRRRFARALATYEAEARVQADVAARLLTLLAETLPDFAPKSALEIGCAGGLLTDLLARRLPALETIAANDLAPEYGAVLAARSRDWRPTLTFLPGDIETLPLAGLFDLIASSSALQWVHDLPGLAAKLARHLRPGGALAIALYGPDNCRELRELTGAGLDYPSPAELEAALSPHFRVPLLREERRIRRFPDGPAVLRHLKATGVNALSPAETGRWTRGRLARFAAEYRERFGDAEGVRLTYHPLYCVATAREGARTHDSIFSGNKENA